MVDYMFSFDCFPEVKELFDFLCRICWWNLEVDFITMYNNIFYLIQCIDVLAYYLTAVHHSLQPDPLS